MRYSKFDKLEFLIVIYGIRQSTFKKDVIHSSVRECGLIPYNSQITLEKIKDYLSPPPSWPSTSPENEIQTPQTSLTARALEKQVIQLENAIPSQHKLIQQKFIKGVLIQAKTAVQL